MTDILVYRRVFALVQGGANLQDEHFEGLDARAAIASAIAVSDVDRGFAPRTDESLKHEVTRFHRESEEGTDVMSVEEKTQYATMYAKVRSGLQLYVDDFDFFDVQACRIASVAAFRAQNKLGLGTQKEVLQLLRGKPQPKD